ncbi:MAG: UDP-3-O-(3-hydroxymyristoyl)glucosamine N-acyltransferase [Bacteroidota bacterium]
MPISVHEIAQMVSGTVVGPSDVMLSGACKIEEAVPGSITFMGSAQYAAYLQTTQASAVIISKNVHLTDKEGTTWILVDDPYASFITVLAKFQEERRTAPKTGAEAPAYLGQNTCLGKDIYRGAFSYIGDHVQLGDSVQVYPHVYIGDQVIIGAHTVIYSGAKIYAESRIGQHCIIHAGAVIGSDGFGFVVQTDGTYKKIPHLGQVIIEDHVEIGANTTIDRATLGKTHIAQGTKMDNLVQIGHNVTVGMHTVIAAQTGIAGSAQLGKGCRIGGQAGVAPHITLGDNTQLAGQTGVTKSYKKGHITLMGMPAYEHKQYLKSYAASKNLPKIVRQVHELAQYMGDKDNRAGQADSC